MTKEKERNDILLRYYEVGSRYERLATEIRRLFDPESPFLADSLYAVKHRIKDKDRLLEKIAKANAKLRRGQKRVTVSNFQDRQEDLLGVRIVCLRLSDLNKIKRYLSDLKADRKIRIVKGPIEKKTFLIRPGVPEVTADLQYSGYSSIHYVIKLGKTANTPSDLADLKAEVQLRTLMEEAWGEIDHKYRYELTRGGTSVPPLVDGGFRDLALYLHAADRHAEHLCEEIERVRSEAKPISRRRRKGRPLLPPVTPVPPLAPPAAAMGVTATDPLASLLKQALGFQPTARTLAYLGERIAQHAYHTGHFSVVDLERLLASDLLKRFTDIYTEVLGQPPFEAADISGRDLDVIPLVNFAIFSSVQSRQLSEAGLRDTLRRRSLPRTPRW